MKDTKYNFLAMTKHKVEYELCKYFNKKILIETNIEDCKEQNTSFHKK